MFHYLSKIVTGVNIIVFMWAMAGLLFHVTDRKAKKDSRFYLYSAVIVVMIAWRVLFRISTARYSTGLILPFIVISSYFFCNAFRKRHILIRLVIYAFIVCTGIIILKMNCDAWSKSHFCFFIAESFDYLDRTGNDYMFRTYSSHFNRTARLAHLHGDHVAIPETRVNKDIANPALAYKKPIVSETVLNIPTDVLSNDVAVYSRLKLLVHLVANPAGTKRQYIYLLSSGNGDSAASGNLSVPNRDRIPAGAHSPERTDAAASPVGNRPGRFASGNQNHLPL